MSGQGTRNKYMSPARNKYMSPAEKIENRLDRIEFRPDN